MKISNRLAGLVNLNDSEDINSLGRTLKRIIKLQLKTVQVCMN